MTAAMSLNFSGTDVSSRAPDVSVVPHEPAQRRAFTASCDAQYGPTVFGGQLGETRAGVHRPGVADQNHQRRVLVAVGVEVAALQVDIVGLAEQLHRGRLVAPPDDW